ncbi:hypothetical protein VNI00_014734 [Paramarasmius palmivorus]|uniref:Uncharacterized protein n=1 Tax=Paramarasmius palmivorus TaxID=297713 RepID=A0AAW0BR70_9AGAR
MSSPHVYLSRIVRVHNIPELCNIDPWFLGHSEADKDANEGRRYSSPVPQASGIDPGADQKAWEAARSVQGLGVATYFVVTWLGPNVSQDLRQAIREILGPGKKLQGLRLALVQQCRDFHMRCSGPNHRLRSAITTPFGKLLTLWHAPKRPSPPTSLPICEGHYCIVGFDRNNKRPQLSVWHEAGVVLELPPGIFVIYLTLPPLRR